MLEVVVGSVVIFERGMRDLLSSVLRTSSHAPATRRSVVILMDGLCICDV